MKNNVLLEYDASVDKKRRCVIKGLSSIGRYHVQVLNSGYVILAPRVLAHLEDLSERTKKTIMESAKNFKKGRVSKPINFAEHEDYLKA